MSLLTLPPELLEIILKKLDTKSIYNLYETCCYLRNVMPGLVRELHFSLNTLATAKSLQSDFFKDLSGRLLILNLSGVRDLTKTSLLPALRKLKHLTDLDVSFTNILMLDLFQIIQMRPTLKNLSINFAFGKKYKITKDLLLKFQLAFEGLEKVNFVGSTFDLLYEYAAISMLKKSNLSNLQFTVCSTDYAVIYSNDIELDTSVLARLSVFKIYSLICYDSLPRLPVIKLLNLENYEIVVFQNCPNTLIHASPLLKEFICKNFDIQVNSLSDLSSVVVGHVAVKLWHRENTQFDSKFFSNFLTFLKQYLVFRFDSCNCAPVPTKYNWYSVEQSCLAVDNVHSNDIHDLDKDMVFKKARIAQQSLVLNYDDAFRNKEKNINLKIIFKDPLTRPVNMNSSDLFRKISYLSLDGNVHYTADFFKNIFKKCNCLVTLVINKDKGNFSVATLLSDIPKSKTLKNLLINVNMLPFSPLFIILSECKSLENIDLAGLSTPYSHTLPNPTDLFKNCENLYSICIKTDIAYREKTLRLYKNVSSNLGRHYLNVDIIPFTNDGLYSPYFNVFNMYQLKPM